jgi:hypothetical protein
VFVLVWSSETEDGKDSLVDPNPIVYTRPADFENYD